MQRSDFPQQPSPRGLAAGQDTLAESGFCIIRGAIAPNVLRQLQDACRVALDPESGDVRARSKTGHACAARNLIESVPIVRTFWQQSRLGVFLSSHLGADFGLVRVLFFDKPPDRTWALPWHKDLAIAVADNTLPSSNFDRPSIKAGVPHVMAPESVLLRMLTLRVHLDQVTDENGPLRVVPKSHVSIDADGLGVQNAKTIYASPGDVLAMRPLLRHCSGFSRTGTALHRRILHLEFASQRQLPDGFRWHDYVNRQCPTADQMC